MNNKYTHKLKIFMMGDLLKTLRKKKRMTQNDVSQILGIKRELYNAWENNYSKPSLQSLGKLSDFFNVSLAQLIGLEETEKTESVEQVEYDDSKKFGVYLKIVRKERGLTAGGLARKSNISQAYVSTIESGKRNRPHPDVLRKLSVGLDIPYMELMRQAGYLEE